MGSRKATALSIGGSAKAAGSTTAGGSFSLGRAAERGKQSLRLIRLAAGAAQTAVVSIQPLQHLKAVLALTTFIFINRHLFPILLKIPLIV